MELNPEKSFSFLRSIANALRLHRARYLHIWKTLNQRDIARFDKTRYCYPTEKHNRWGGAREYFAQTSNYKVINLLALNPEDRLIIEDNNLSVDKLNLIGQNDNIAQQEIYLKYFNQNSTLNYSQSKLPLNNTIKELSDRTAFQKAMLTGYIYTICPFSGKVLRTNQSFLVTRTICAYRFSSNRVFYLIATNYLFEKALIYIPDFELIIKLCGKTYKEETQIINRVKAFVVTNWQQVMSYIASDKRKEVAALVGVDRNLGHNMWNELAGIHELYEDKSLCKVDKFLIPPYDVFGKIEDIFPEIPSQKIIQSSDINGDHLGNIALENNYFVFRPRGLFIKEELSSRIYQLSIQNCPSSTLSQIEEAKKHFPLIWIDLRLNKRFWNSQIVGFSQIIKKLSGEFPNLGIVFDGFSRLAKDLDYGSEDMIRKTAVIEKERAVVEQILSLASDCNPTIYNNIGCTIYESVIWAHAVDFYIAHWGAGLTKTTFVANKPGVVHTNQYGLNTLLEKRFYCYERENGIVPKFVSKDSVVDIKDSNRMDINYSYYCDWEAIYDEVVKLIPTLTTKYQIH